MRTHFYFFNFSSENVFISLSHEDNAIFIEELAREAKSHSTIYIYINVNEAQLVEKERNKNMMIITQFDGDFD